MILDEVLIWFSGFFLACGISTSRDPFEPPKWYYIYTGLGLLLIGVAISLKT